MNYWPDIGLCKSCVYKKMKKSSYKTLFKKGKYFIKYKYTYITKLLPISKYKKSYY